MTTIKLVETDEELRATFPVMVQLRTHLTEAGYLAQVAHQRANDNYAVAAVFEGDRVVAAAGFRLATALALGSYVYIDDLVTDADTRSKGHGRALLDWIGDYGRARGCTSLHLDSGVQRHAAHRFYLRERMDIVFFHFRKMLG